MSSSKIIQLLHFINNRVQCKKYVLIFTFIFILLMLHLFFYFYFSKSSFTNSSPPLHIFEASIFVPTTVMGILASIFGFFISVDVIYACVRSKCNKRLLKKTVEKGTCPKVGLGDKLVPRPLIVDRLKKILQPHKNHSFYHLICGEIGTGKTTLIRIASNEVGCGVIYVDIPENSNQLGKAFGKAINFAFEDVSYTKQLMRKIKADENKPKISGWEKALAVFNRASEEYKARHDKPMVIIYDNVNHLVHENPKILDILQDEAKYSADERLYTAIFVCNGESVLQRMESRSSWSRAKKPVLEIGDLSKEESIKYLTEKRNIKEVDAENIFNLVGGHIVELKVVADDFLAEQEFETIKQKVLVEAEKKFNTAQILPNDPYYEIGKSIINDLLKSNKLSYLAFRKYFNNTKECDEMLSRNIFSYRPEANIVTFQSKSIECYIYENANIYSWNLQSAHSNQ